MEVILVSEVTSLGYPGSVVTVKDGFARNYLIPQKLAVKKTKRSMQVLEKQKEEFDKITEEKNQHYKDMLQTIEALKDFEIKANVGEDGKLFGRITNRQLSEALRGHNIEVDKRQIILKDQIKIAGQYIAYIHLNKNHKTQLHFTVVPK